MFLLVPAYPGCPGSKAVKRSLLLLSHCFSGMWWLTVDWYQLACVHCTDLKQTVAGFVTAEEGV